MGDCWQYRAHYSRRPTREKLLAGPRSRPAAVATASVTRCASTMEPVICVPILSQQLVHILYVQACRNCALVARAICAPRWYTREQSPASVLGFVQAASDVHGQTVEKSTGSQTASAASVSFDSRSIANNRDSEPWMTMTGLRLTVASAAELVFAARTSRATHAVMPPASTGIDSSYTTAAIRIIATRVLVAIAVLSPNPFRARMYLKYGGDPQTRSTCSFRQRQRGAGTPNALAILRR